MDQNEQEDIINTFLSNLVDNRFYDLPTDLREYIHEINRKSMFEECMEQIKPREKYPISTMFLDRPSLPWGRISKMYQKKYGIEYTKQPRNHRAVTGLYPIILCGDMVLSKKNMIKKLEENGVEIKKSWRKVDMIRKLMKL